MNGARSASAPAATTRPASRPSITRSWPLVSPCTGVSLEAATRVGESGWLALGYRGGNTEVAIPVPADELPDDPLRRAEVASVAAMLQRDAPEPYARALAGAGSLADAIR